MQQKQDRGAASLLHSLNNAWAWLANRFGEESEVNSNHSSENPVNDSIDSDADSGNNSDEYSAGSDQESSGYSSTEDGDELALSTHARLLLTHPEMTQPSADAIADKFIEELSSSTEVQIPKVHHSLLRSAVLLLLNSSIAAAHHTMKANITMVGPDHRPYLFQFDPRFSQFHDLVQDFIQGACLMNVTDSTHHNLMSRALESNNNPGIISLVSSSVMEFPATTWRMISGMSEMVSSIADPTILWEMFKSFNRIYPTHEIAALSCSKQACGSKDVQDCLVSRVQPKVDEIQGTETTRLIVGTVFTILISLIVIGIITACCCSRNRRHRNAQARDPGPVALSEITADHEVAHNGAYGSVNK